MSKISQTELAINEVIEQIKNLALIHNATAVFHLPACDKQELKDYAAKINTTLIKPEDNLFFNRYTLKIDVQPGVQLLCHSNEIFFDQVERDCVGAPHELPSHEPCGSQK